MRAGLTPNAVQWWRCGGLRGPNLAECVAVRRRFRAKVGVFWQSLVSPHLSVRRESGETRESPLGGREACPANRSSASLVEHRHHPAVGDGRGLDRNIDLVNADSRDVHEGTPRPGCPERFGGGDGMWSGRVVLDFTTAPVPGAGTTRIDHGACRQALPPPARTREAQDEDIANRCVSARHPAQETQAPIVCSRVIVDSLRTRSTSRQP